MLGSHSLSTDPSGTFSFSFAFPTPAGGARFVTATATDSNGNTSEFSQQLGVDHPPTAAINFTSVTVNEGVLVPFDGSGSTSPDGAALSYAWSFGDGATATGPSPSHTYTSAGTDNVTLTVSDGFGGVSQATAVVTVVDVPPVFTPNSFTAPTRFTTSAPGNGFGAAVAAINGNVAIGAPMDSGPGAQSTSTTASRPTTGSRRPTRTALVHVFADPNPATGDEFGASLAVVGNELVVGAPGSSRSGTGDGIAYVFDANADSTTFGQLLATLVIPDPDAQAAAQFGAAVGAADSNIVIGAAGKDGGSGEVYEFEGDPTQPNFGASCSTSRTRTRNWAHSSARPSAAWAPI